MGEGGQDEKAREENSGEIVALGAPQLSQNSDPRATTRAPSHAYPIAGQALTR